MKVQIIFLVSESKQGTRKKYEALNSFSGCKEGLEQTIDVMCGLSDKDESYRGLKRIMININIVNDKIVYVDEKKIEKLHYLKKLTIKDKRKSSKEQSL